MKVLNGFTSLDFFHCTKISFDFEIIFHTKKKGSLAKQKLFFCGIAVNCVNPLLETVRKRKIICLSVNGIEKTHDSTNCHCLHLHGLESQIQPEISLPG